MPALLAPKEGISEAIVTSRTSLRQLPYYEVHRFTRSVTTNALVLRDLANLRVGDNPEVGSSVLLIGVAWIQSNFEPMRKQVALFEL